MAAVAVAIILGCSIDAFLYRPLRKKGATRETTFLASLGFGTAGVAILLFVFSSTPKRLAGFPTKMLSVEKLFLAWLI